MKLLALATAIVCAACWNRPPAAPHYDTADGPIPVVITNNSPVEMCTVTLAPSLTKMPRVATMYVAQPGVSPSLKPGQSVRANVKPGSYEIHAENCGFTAQTARQMDEFDITGPFAVDLDHESPSVPAGYQRLTLEVQDVGSHSSEPEPSQASCLPAGARLAYPPDASKCCSGHYSYPGTHDERSRCT